MISLERKWAYLATETSWFNGLGLAACIEDTHRLGVHYRTIGLILGILKISIIFVKQRLK